MTARTETLSKDVEELRAAIDKLTSDVSAIGKSVAGDARASASQKASEMSDAAKQKAAEIGEKGQAAKGAVEVLTRYMAKELGPRGISVNTLAPGAVETDFGGGVVRDTPGLNQQIAAMTALGRVGLPEDIGPAIANLLAPDNHWITAQRIEVSGGQGL